MGNLVTLPIGKVGNLKIDVSPKESDVSIDLDPTLGLCINASVKVQNKIVGKALCEVLKKMIPGTVDDAIFNVIEGALDNIPE